MQEGIGFSKGYSVAEMSVVQWERVQIILIGIGGKNDGLKRRRCFDLTEVHTDKFEGKKTYEKE